MKAAVLLGLVLLGATASGAAALSPTPGATDPRIQSVQFDPDQVVEVRGRLGYQVTVEFGPDEQVANVAIGDASAWQAQPDRRGNLLFVRPLIAGMTTNMTVVTDQRRYAFELTPADDAGAGPAAPYLLKFRYPPAPAAPVRMAAAVQNRDYGFKGPHGLKPVEVFDDGRFTFFRWDREASVPAIFVQAPGGGETLVNSAFRDGYMVVEQTAQTFVLRNGREQATVTKGQAR